MGVGRRHCDIGRTRLVEFKQLWTRHPREPNDGGSGKSIDDITTARVNWDATAEATLDPEEDVPSWSRSRPLQSALEYGP
jgi:hypothetical protein